MSISGNATIAKNRSRWLTPSFKVFEATPSRSIADKMKSSRMI